MNHLQPRALVQPEPAIDNRAIKPGLVFRRRAFQLVDEALRPSRYRCRLPHRFERVRRFNQLAGGGERAIGDEFHAANPGLPLGAIAGNRYYPRTVSAVVLRNWRIALACSILAKLGCCSGHCKTSCQPAKGQLRKATEGREYASSASTPSVYFLHYAMCAASCRSTSTTPVSTPRKQRTADVHRRWRVHLT